VKYAAFLLPKDSKLTGRERADELQKRADEAQKFAEAMLNKGAKFDELAKANGATAVGETPMFELNAAPKELDGNANAAHAAFELKPDQTSDVISAENGSYVLLLAGKEEARPQSFDEVKTKLVDELKEERAREAMNLKAGEIRKKIDAEMKGGKAFAQAAEAAGVKAEKLPPFSASDPGALRTSPDGPDIMRRATELAVDQVSEFVPTQAGGVIVHLDRQLPIDETEFNKQKELLTERAVKQKREAIFQEWLRTRRKAANIDGPQRG
jgi:parvulin-like peptidyl-prolyl isomerase